MGTLSRLLVVYALVGTSLYAPASGHVALTYPPARKYGLDFLDNARTPPPCGMPKGDIKTSVIQGTVLNVTWHLAYPHQGGFYLELLDSNEQHKMFLAPAEGHFIATDATAQYYELKIPSSLECRNCTLRLIRQAVEWGSRYRFWSCADIDILPRSEVKRTCNGNGRFFSNRCLCNKRFFGSECQFENECDEDKDCGDRFGKCLDVDATSYPKKQCFCSRGAYGFRCSKMSHIRSETQVNLGVYSRRNLSDAMTLYWRVLREEGQLEVVIVNKGISYAAVGWRPADATTSCRQFPKLDGPPPPKKFISREPKPTTAKPEPEEKAEPEPEPEGEPEHVGEPEPEPTPEGTAEPSPKENNEISFPDGFFATKRTASITSTEREPETITVSDQDKQSLSLADRVAQFSGRKKRSAQSDEAPFFAAPLLKPARRVTVKTTEAEPKPTAAATTKPVTVTTTAAVAKPEPEPSTDSKPEPEPNGEPSKPEPEPSTDSKPEPEPNGEPSPEPKPSTNNLENPEVGSSAKTTESGAEPEPEPETDSKLQTTAESSREPRAETEPEPTAEGEPKAEGEPEPKAEGEPEPKVEAEPEPKAEGEPKLKAEGEPEPNAEGEPELKAEGEPEPKAEGEPEPKAEGEPDILVEPEPEPGPTTSTASYYPFGSSLHPMDCTDIVIGMARGSFYRAFDYYTRDRSTPRRDEFWGGEDSLTAVFGWEKDGETTILIRKNLTATHPTDYEINDSLMHVIWARGQEPNMYVHYPKSGLEKGPASEPNFYRPDEVKYHGRRDQRGVTTLNFFEGGSPLSQAGGADEINWCGGQWKYPHSCSLSEGNCEYSARWEFIEETDDIFFTVSSSNPKLWTGIGFSDDANMGKSDVIIGWLNPSGGKYFMYDGWLRSRTFPVVDANQGISNMSATQKDGITTLNFSRKRMSKDKQDLSFTDSKCLYLFFPVKGGVVNFVNKRISKHQLTPTVSSQRICIRSCAKFGGADGKPIVFTTTPRPPQLIYDVSFKINNAGENLEIPKRGSDEYMTLVNQILASVEPMFQKIPGFVVADISDLELSESKAVKVITRVTLNKEMYEEKSGPVKTEEDQKKSVEEVHKLVDQSVKSGQIGHLRVEPDFLTVNFLEASKRTSTVTEEGESGEDKGLSIAEFTAKHKYWFIGAGILALIILALIQCIVTMCRKKRNKPPPVSSKERLITNSRWRDYSRGATNYAYETYETEGEPEARRAPSLQRDPDSPYKNGGRGMMGSSGNGHVNGGFPPTKDMGGAYSSGTDSKSSPSHGGYDHTRSLQRPRNAPSVPSSILSDPRTTYSLPRGGSANSSPPPYSTAMQDLTPDFYYLPSQRKYSGEVVRVYVDYNQPK